MPYTCCVPQCRGNYEKDTKVSVFKFPLDNELRIKWIQSIRRKDFVITSSSRVCEKHFTDQDIRWESSGFDEKTGRTITVRLKRPVLTPRAVPCIFPCPSQLSCNATVRKSPATRKKKLKKNQSMPILQQSLKEAEEMKAIVFISLEELQKIRMKQLPNNWNLIDLKKKSKDSEETYILLTGSSQVSDFSNVAPKVEEIEFYPSVSPAPSMPSPPKNSPLTTIVSVFQCEDKTPCIQQKRPGMSLPSYKRSKRKDKNFLMEARDTPINSFSQPSDHEAFGRYISSKLCEFRNSRNCNICEKEILEVVMKHLEADYKNT